MVNAYLGPCGNIDAGDRGGKRCQSVETCRGRRLYGCQRKGSWVMSGGAEDSVEVT